MIVCTFSQGRQGSTAAHARLVAQRTGHLVMQQLHCNAGNSDSGQASVAKKEIEGCIYTADQKKIIEEIVRHALCLSLMYYSI